MPGAPIKACSVHPNEHLGIADRWSVDLLQVQHLGRAVGALHDGLHPVGAVTERRWRRRVVEVLLLLRALRCRLMIGSARSATIRCVTLKASRAGRTRRVRRGKQGV